MGHIRYVSPVRVAIVLLLTGCGSLTESDRPGVDIAINKSRYRTGDTAVITIQNRYDEDLVLLDCDWSLERRTSDAWQVVEAPLCPGIVSLPIKAGETRVLGPWVSDYYGASVDADYRFRIHLGITDGQATRRLPAEETSTPTFRLVSNQPK